MAYTPVYIGVFNCQVSTMAMKLATSVTRFGKYSQLGQFLWVYLLFGRIFSYFGKLMMMWGKF